MAKPYDDDLRIKFLAAYDRAEGTIGELAARFGVSEAWGWKISASRNRSGQAARIRHHPGRKRLAGAEVEKLVLKWLDDKPDLTLSELQVKLDEQARISLSLSAVLLLVRRLGLRLKKSPPALRSGTAKPTGSNAQSSY